jgi:hypothetical protein
MSGLYFEIVYDCLIPNTFLLAINDHIPILFDAVHLCIWNVVVKSPNNESNRV